MRLNKIKLSGFKSFLEPTTLLFDTPLTGIVGPNGCGKSNVVDAIRWVIGESSAKQLRGESLSDVIFAGSTSRKPVGKAQVELLFDNSAQRFGGRFAEYHEISIKREITRENGSTYFLNQTPCRRRDILDVLLGTGLGPRSYAVIEQGMISHLIAATPEELRGYLEEAAMVSKYKEKRKEAENRIANTRENIHRINDLSVEVEAQLEKVKVQAETAQIFKTQKAALQKVSAQLEALEMKGLQKKLKQNESAIEEKEAALADLHHKETEIDQKQVRLTIQYEQESEALSKEQDEYYRISIEISRLEQSIKDAKAQTHRLAETLTQFERNQEHLNQQLTQDQSQLEILQRQFVENEPLLTLGTTRLTASQNDLSETQGAWRAWQHEWEAFNKSYMQTQQSMEVKRHQLQQLQRLLDSLKQQSHRLHQEQTEIHQEPCTQEIVGWETEADAFSSRIELLQNQIRTVEEKMQIVEAEAQRVATQIHANQGKLQALEAEQASLKALQQLALGEGKHRKQVADWLTEQGHITLTYFAETLQVTPGWEKALEFVLKDILNAICVENIPYLAQSLPLANGLRLIEQKKFSQETSDALSAPARERLINKITSHQATLPAWLADIYTASSLEEALQLIACLKPHESVITPEGVWLGCSWLKTLDPQAERSGMLARQQRMETLAIEIAQNQSMFSKLDQQQKTLGKQLEIFTSDIKHLQQEKRQQEDQKTQLTANIKAKKSYLAQIEGRSKRIEEEITTLVTQIQEQEVEYQEIEKALAILQIALEKDQETEKRLQTDKQNLNQTFEAAKTALKNHEDQVTHLKSLQDSTQKQIQYLEQQIVRTQEQKQSLDQQISWVHSQEKEAQSILPRQETEWATYKEKQQHSEARLATIKVAHQQTEETLKQLKKHQDEEKSTQDQLRKNLERLRIDYETAQVQLKHHQAQFQKLGFELNEIIEQLPKDARKTRYIEEQEHLQESIQGLGDINLAATAEYEALLKRQTYLEAQSLDLQAGLDTLEAAIRKIDQETCLQLKHTFEQVNTHFKALFSKIFEGGQAYLELTQDDWLSTGIVVKAQPKGKRNTTIHLLSGGEKALTAIALVFSFFQLNPAPFCILDEVDAPLDDHNISRFCKLVEEMSQTLQFIFISHSKVTLTMAKQLVGVTMREPGVSRIVSVNIEEAVKMAQA